MNIFEPLLCSKFYTLLHLEKTEMCPSETFPNMLRIWGENQDTLSTRQTGIHAVKEQ